MYRTSKDIGKRLGYSDEDLSTPGHDALCIWACENAGSLVDQIACEFVNTRRNKEIDWFRKEEASRVAKAEENEKSNEKRRELYGKAGDAKAIESETKAPQLTDDDKEIEFDKPLLEVSVSGGWIDVLIRCVAKMSVYVSDIDYRTAMYIAPKRVEWGAGHFDIAIEVKTSIRSLGELLRQLRVYEKAAISGRPLLICVLSPDDRFATQIREQGFLFIRKDLPT